MSNYSELDETDLTALHRILLKEKGGLEQKALLSAAIDSETFCAFFRERVKSTAGDAPKLFPGPLTEQSFKDMPQDSEQTAYNIWADVTPRIACRITFWGEVTLLHVEYGLIRESSWLAMNGGTTETGEERIELALGKQDVKLMDDCVRTIFRRMSGLPMARGRRSVFINPTFGRAWWRERIVNRIVNREGIRDRAAILQTVRLSQQYWENLVRMLVSQGTVYGSAVVQDAFINSLARFIVEYDKSPLRSASTLNMAMRRFSNIAASREVGALDFDEVSELVDDLLLTVHEEGVTSP